MKWKLYNLNTGAGGMELTFFFLIKFIFSVKKNYHFISFPPIFRFVPISIQFYDNSSLHVSVLDSYYCTRVEGRHMQSAFTTNINKANSHPHLNLLNVDESQWNFQEHIIVKQWIFICLLYKLCRSGYTSNNSKRNMP